MDKSRGFALPRRLGRISEASLQGGPSRSAHPAACVFNRVSKYGDTNRPPNRISHQESVLSGYGYPTTVATTLQPPFLPRLESRGLSEDLMMPLLSVTTDTQTWVNAGWDITSLNLVSAVEPPRLTTAFVGWDPGNAAWLGELKIILSEPYRAIDMAEHQALLDQSLKEYKDIWRDLAQR